MAKRGRPKKDILESTDLEDFNNFQCTLKYNINEIGIENLTDKEKAFIDEFLLNDADDDWTTKIKALKFKHFILHKPLTHDECTYFIDLDNNGTKPSPTKKLTKMGVCKIEIRACEKLRKAFGSKFNIFELKDVMNLDKCRTAIGPVDWSKR